MKIEVCFLCNHQVGDNGDRLEYLPITAQIGFLAQRALKVSVCYECFRTRYKEFRKILEDHVKALKNALMNDV